jgi:truncated hemoglobin YjbI
MKLRHWTCACASLFLLAASASAERIYAVDSRAVLVSFDSDRPGAILTMNVIRGLRPGESIAGIDFRPANKKLYALSSTLRLYIIDPVTGAATPVGGGPITTSLTGTRFGFDFNPTVDRIRIVTNTGQNLRAHPDTGALVTPDGQLNYADGGAPNVVASAYTNSVAGATTTTLYNFDLARRAIVTQAPPNDGTLTPFLVIRGDFSDVTGFDISPMPGNKGYLATRENGAARVQLYEIDFANSRATLTGTIGTLDQITAIAVEPPGVPTLFTNLGGLTAISAVVDEFLGIVVADNRINKFFAQTVASPQRVAALRQNLIDQVCAGAGGPCTYQGRDMKTAHRSMQITDVEFDALVEDLVKALDKFNVPLPEKAALLGVLAPMRADIVEKKQMQVLAGQ